MTKTIARKNERKEQKEFPKQIPGGWLDTFNSFKTLWHKPTKIWKWGCHKHCNGASAECKRPYLSPPRLQKSNSGITEDPDWIWNMDETRVAGLYRKQGNSCFLFSTHCERNNTSFKKPGNPFKAFIVAFASVTKLPPFLIFEGKKNMMHWYDALPLKNFQRFHRSTTRANIFWLILWNSICLGYKKRFRNNGNDKVRHELYYSTRKSEAENKPYVTPVVWCTQVAQWVCMVRKW